MPRLQIEDLLKAGAHFGHLTRRWNPKMKPYIFMEKNGIHILDLKKTVQMAEDALNAVEAIAGTGKDILFVGTKKQAKAIIAEQAERCGMPYVSERWLGGMLTNFATIRQSIRRLNAIERMENDGTFDIITKKERLMLTREKEKLLKVLGGIAEMTRLPAALYVVDVKKEHIAVKEANLLGIPIFAMVDTNCDPELITHVIPANDDSIRSIELITTAVADAIINATTAQKEEDTEEVTQEEGN
jgi:small subunit ribosomal protein S2